MSDDFFLTSSLFKAKILQSTCFWSNLQANLFTSTAIRLAECLIGQGRVHFFGKTKLFL
jgi:hypothetical protein